MRNLHKDITDRVIAALQAGTVPWRKPWSAKAAEGVSFRPRNAVTGRAYSGINVLLLWGKMDDCGFKDGRFLTFKQAKEKGGSVRKGEKGTEIVYVNSLEREDRDNPGKVKRIPFLKSYYVFNVSQCDGLTLEADEAPRPIARHERDETIDAFVSATGADIRHGEARAYYRHGPGVDFVNMPILASFTSSHGYYATLFHELGHWTGADKRLNRTFGRKFGDRAYAAEELVAELTSAFVCAEFGIDNDGQDAAYIATWIKFLSDHETAIVTAAAAASKAVEFMRGLAVEAPDELPIAA